MKNLTAITRGRPRAEDALDQRRSEGSPDDAKDALYGADLGDSEETSELRTNSSSGPPFSAVKCNDSGAIVKPQLPPRQDPTVPARLAYIGASMEDSRARSL